MAQETDTFKTQIIALNRTTLPAKTMKFLKLKEGDWVEITVKRLR